MSKAINSTPFLESLLSNGNTTLYPKSYATHRCSPTRAAFLSGIYPFRYGLGKHALKATVPTHVLDPSLKAKGSLKTHNCSFAQNWLGITAQTFSPVD